MSRDKSFFIQVITLAAGLGMGMSVWASPDLVAHDFFSNLAVILCAFSGGWGLRAWKGGDEK